MSNNYNEVFTSRAILDLRGFFLVTDEMDIVDDPKVIFKSLRVDELYLLNYIEKLDFKDKCIVYEELVRENVIEVFGYTGVGISTAYSPAGIIDMIAEAVLQLTYEYLVNNESTKYNYATNNVTYMHSMQAIVAHYLNIPFNEVEKLPLNELYSKYAICAITFPAQVQPLQIKEDLQ